MKFAAKQKPMLFLSSSPKEVSEMLSYVKKISKKYEFVLLLKADQSLIPRFLPAYLNAYLRHEEDSLKAKSIEMEMLLFIAGTLRTEKAIADYGASDNKSFLVFATSKPVFTKFSKAVKLKVLKQYKLGLDLDVASDVARLAFAED